MKILNIYGQLSWHTDARIIGNREGLIALKEELERAIRKDKITLVKNSYYRSTFFASDGEGYEMLVEVHNDEWGIKGGPDSYWNKPDSRPEYTSIENTR